MNFSSRGGSLAPERVNRNDFATRLELGRLDRVLRSLVRLWAELTGASDEGDRESKSLLKVEVRCDFAPRGLSDEVGSGQKRE
jgi:hypothetical protein